jgi:hypothetical protein
MNFMKYAAPWRAPAIRRRLRNTAKHPPAGKDTATTEYYMGRMVGLCPKCATAALSDRRQRIMTILTTPIA